MTHRDSSPSIADELRDNRGWLIALGILLIVLGAIAFLNLLLATIASVYYVGILMILGGVAQLVLAFRVRGWGRITLLILGAILYGLAGFFTFLNPLLASSVLTLMLAAFLIASGIMRIIMAIRERPRRNWGWMLTGGILGVAVALVIIAGWPVNSLWILGLLLAVDLIGQGFSWLFIGIGLGQR